MGELGNMEQIEPVSPDNQEPTIKTLLKMLLEFAQDASLFAVSAALALDRLLDGYSFSRAPGRFLGAEIRRSCTSRRGP